MSRENLHRIIEDLHPDDYAEAERALSRLLNPDASTLERTEAPAVPLRSLLFASVRLRLYPKGPTAYRPRYKGGQAGPRP